MRPTRVFTRPLLLIVITCMTFGQAARASDAPQPAPSFRNDVMAALSKAGCNLGTCHGNANGKGGFQLSLRGEDMGADHLALTREAFGRRINPFQPDASLILLKATTQIAHEGGKRFDKDSPEYDILRRWIAAGAPNDRKTAPRLTGLRVSNTDAVLIEPKHELALRVTATFSEGSKRDVTRLAVYEPTDTLTHVTLNGRVTRGEMAPKRVESTVIVRYLERQLPVRIAFVPKQSDFKWSDPPTANMIDEHVFAKLKRLRMNPADLSSDNVFVRRVYLDIIGLPPTADEARTFVNDKAPDKRPKLIDALLQRPEFADHWAVKWADLLRIEEKVLDTKGVEVFHKWVRDSIADGKPMDAFARELIAARGSTYKNPPANYWRALRKPAARAEATAQLFLGTRLQCAQCHNHPFEKWTQDDYYGFAANFARVNYKVINNKRKDKFDKHQFIGEQEVFIDKKGEVKDPRTGKAAKPRLLGTTDTPKPKDKDEVQVVANWLTSPQNDLFVKTMVNRVWASMLGVGLVEPIDDLRATNPASHPKLFDLLAKDFVEHQFDLRHLVRLIANSRTYQLSYHVNDSNRDDTRNYARAVVRRLTAEQLIDSVGLALDAKPKFNGLPGSIRAAQVPGVNAVYRDKDPSPGDRFLKLFGKPDRLLNCTCERSDDTTMGQVFELTSGPMLNQAIRKDGNRIDRLLKAKKDHTWVVNELYWWTLTREPSKRELDAAVAHLTKHKNKRAALEDVAWALVNAKAFLLRH